MTEQQLLDPDAFDPDAPIFDRNGVRRSKDGRPYVKSVCPAVTESDRTKRCVDGRIPGKREGTTKQCPKCKGAGSKELLYTRCTTFVGALEDRQGLETWKIRTALLGVAADHRSRAGLALDDDRIDGDSILRRLLRTELDDLGALDTLADEAFEAGDGYEKARKGTDLHGVMERVDRAEPLPEHLTFDDRRDIAAWLRLLDTYRLQPLDVERFVVNDELKVAGTYDRRVVSTDPRLACWQPGCDRDGYEKAPKPKVLDLKTGRVDYGGGKMRQQLALYARSENYDPETGERSRQDVCTHRGFIVWLPAGSGEAHLLSCDLVAGWRDVLLSREVREHRRVTKTGALQLVDDPLALD